MGDDFEILGSHGVMTRETAATIVSHGPTDQGLQKHKEEEDKLHRVHGAGVRKK